MEYNMRIVRGIDYYTGLVFEGANADDRRLGSLFGGGRYDALPRTFGRPDLSATGAAGGVEREAMSMAVESGTPRVSAMVACASPEVSAYAAEVLARLRAVGVPSDLSPPGKSLGKQLEDASKAKVPWVVIVGIKERGSKTVTLRDMVGGKEEVVPVPEAARRLSAP